MPRRLDGAPVKNIDPSPRGTMRRAASCAVKKAVKKPLRQVSSISVASTSRKPLSDRPPMLKIVAPTGPNAASASSKRRCTPPLSKASTAKARARPPVAPISAAIRPDCACERAASATGCPPAANRLPIALPRPLPTPMMIASFGWLISCPPLCCRPSIVGEALRAFDEEAIDARDARGGFLFVQISQQRLHDFAVLGGKAERNGVAFHRVAPRVEIATLGIEPLLACAISIEQRFRRLGMRGKAGLANDDRVVDGVNPGAAEIIALRGCPIRKEAAQLALARRALAVLGARSRHRSRHRPASARDRPRRSRRGLPWAAQS